MIADARGEAARFNAILDEYQKAPDVTRQRLYLETIERIYGGMEKVIIDQGRGPQQGGVVPLLPLNDLMRSRVQETGEASMIRSALGFAAAAVVVYRWRLDVLGRPDRAGDRHPVRPAGSRDHAAGAQLQDPVHPAGHQPRTRILDLESASIEAITSTRSVSWSMPSPATGSRIRCGTSRRRPVPRFRGNQQLGTYMDAALRRVVGESTFLLLVKEDRIGLMSKIRDQVNSEAAALGVAIVDIRIRRADLPDQNSQAVFRRMCRPRRQREAAELRAQGVEISDRIKAQADRTVYGHEGGSRPYRPRGARSR